MEKKYLKHLLQKNFEKKNFKSYFNIKSTKKKPYLHYDIFYIYCCMNDVCKALN